jgi:hypothetical protein
MKNIFYIFLAILFLNACSKNKGSVMCIKTRFVFLNENHQDIFNKYNPNHIDSSKFKVLDSDGVEFYRTFWPDTINSTTKVRVSLDGADIPELRDTTYLVFDTLNIDTIFTVFAKTENSLYPEEIYYNGELIESNINVTQCGIQLHEIIMREDR